MGLGIKTVTLHRPSESLKRRIRRLSSSATTKVSAAPFPNSNTAEDGNVGAADFLEMATYGN